MFFDAFSRLFRQLHERWRISRARAAAEARRTRVHRERFRLLRGIARPFRVVNGDRLAWIGAALLVAALLPFLFRAAEDRPRMLVAATVAVGFLLRAFSVQTAAIGEARRDAGRDDLARAFLSLALGSDGDRAAEAAAVLVGASLYVDRELAAIAAMPTGTGLAAAPIAPEYARTSRYVRRGLWAAAVFVPALLGYWHIRYDVATAAAGYLDSVLLLVTGVVAWCLADAREARRYELGAAGRLGWALVYLTGFFALPVLLRLLGIAALRPGILLGSVATTLVTIPLLRAIDPLDPLRIARRVFVIFGTLLPIVFVAALAGNARADSFRVAMVLLATGLCLLVGLFVRALEAPLLPAAGRLLERLHHARDSLASAPDPEALEQALFALRDRRLPGLSPAEGPSWLATDPERRIVVDGAGYPRTVAAHLAPEVLACAAGEPFGILRVEVLEALEVKRPDLRPTLARFRDEDLFCVVAVVRDGLLRGALVIPRGDRYAFLAVEEAVSLRKLVDLFAETAARRDEKLAAAARERALVGERDQQVEEVLRLEHEAVRASRRHRLATERVARAIPFAEPQHEARADLLSDSALSVNFTGRRRDRAAETGRDRDRTAETGRDRDRGPATLQELRQPGFYGTAAREAASRLERRFGAFAAAWVVTPPGVDPLPFFARAHLASPLADGPFVVVDGSEPRDRDLARWNDPARSPLAAAVDGLLVVLDPLTLPLAVQTLVGEAIAARRLPWGDATPLRTVLAVATVALPDEETQKAFSGRLVDAARAPILLPKLRERPEDLRFLVTEALSRQALRVRGHVMGIDDRAFAILIEHPFDDDDVELNALVARLVRVVKGDVVRREDVIAALAREAPVLPPSAPSPPSRRSRRRRA